MRIAIVSDFHGNRTAFEAVLADLRQTSPDLILHGGDLADSGSSPAWVVDCVRDLGWRGVAGNTDELLFKPESLREFAGKSPSLQPMFSAIAEMAAATRVALGEERLGWLARLPRVWINSPVALVHASPENLWRAPSADAAASELETTYEPLEQPVAVYAHIHRPYTRTVSGMTVANTGSVSLSYDGDRRSAYLLLDGSQPTIRRVEYDVDRELEALSTSGLPHAAWIASMLVSGTPQPFC